MVTRCTSEDEMISLEKVWDVILSLIRKMDVILAKLNICRAFPRTYRPPLRMWSMGRFASQMCSLHVFIPNGTRNHLVNGDTTIFAARDYET